MPEESTTAVIQRYLDALPGDAAAEPIIRELLERAIGRLRLLCGTLLYRSYPRLTRPPMNLETDELLGGVVAGLTHRNRKCLLYVAVTCDRHLVGGVVGRGDQRVSGDEA